MCTKFSSLCCIRMRATSFRFQREQLAVHWREWMTDRTLQLYNSNRVYYSLERDIAGSAESSSDSNMDIDVDGNTFVDAEIVALKGETPSAAARIDNPDQRITEDVSVTLINYTPCLTILSSPPQQLLSISHRSEHSLHLAYNSSSLSSLQLLI